jgi:hypothetical protein
MVATMRATGTMAMWVSGNRLTLAGVRAGEQHQRAGFGDRAEAAGNADRIGFDRGAHGDIESGSNPVEPGHIGRDDGLRREQLAAR